MSLGTLGCSLRGQRGDVLEQLVAVHRAPVLVSHRLHLALQKRWVHRAAFLQDLWVQQTQRHKQGSVFRI